ncbi:MAG TPA: C-terminal binding protein [Chloroflexota bacterium]|nr:C-terminal binding protein [Chloroflexota bacterium]
MTTTTIFVADPPYAPDHYAAEREVAAAFGAELILGNETPSRLRDAEVILISAIPVPAEAMPALTRCRMIVRYGIGVDIIDVVAATSHGIVVANTPTYCVTEVADHTAGLILGFTRRIPWLDRQVRDMAWSAAGSQLWEVHRISTLTLGIIGLGKIGRQVAHRMLPFGPRILGHDPQLSPGAIEALGAIPSTMDDILRESDILSLHVPLMASTYHLIDEDALSLMKPSAVLINASRGAVVDERALIRALQDQRLYGAALDVLEREPPAPDNPLLAMDPRRVILTPHFAASSAESVAQQHHEVAAALRSLLDDRWPDATINPQVIPRRPLSH